MIAIALPFICFNDIKYSYQNSNEFDFRFLITSHLIYSNINIIHIPTNIYKMYNRDRENCENRWTKKKMEVANKLCVSHFGFKHRFTVLDVQEYIEILKFQCTYLFKLFSVLFINYTTTTFIYFFFIALWRNFHFFTTIQRYF